MASHPDKVSDSGNLHEDTDETEKDVESGDREDHSAEGRREQVEEPVKDPNLIEWNGPDDPEYPMNWSVMKKGIITFTLGLMTFCATFASAVFSNAMVPIAMEYGVSTEVTTLGTSLFVLGFAVGPLVSSIFQAERPETFPPGCYQCCDQKGWFGSSRVSFDFPITSLDH